MNQPQQAFEKFAPAKSSSVGSWERWTREHTDVMALAVIAFGCLLRIREAWGTFLNPDEAVHFFIADRSSLDAVYNASLTQAHPPLLFFVLYALRPFGNSELVLRLPSILAGTVFCWVLFRWLVRTLGPAVALVGVIFAALLPTMISVTAQARQYGLLLLFLISGACFLESALTDDSPALMLASAISLWLAMLSHYSAFLFIAALGVYALLRFKGSEFSARTIIAWTVNQILTLTLAIFLYLTHISKIRGTAMAEQAFDIWLRRSYFHRGQENPLTFLVTRSFSVFQYIAGQLVIGDILAVLFLLGVALLLRGKVQSLGVRRLPFGSFLFAPFILNFTAALVDVYPFGGTRHCVYLSIVAIAGIAACVVTVTRQSALRAVAIALSIFALCFALHSTQHPFIARADQQRSHVYQAADFIREQIPVADPILVDYESGIELGHYGCEQRTTTYDASIPGFLVFHCSGHRFISTVPEVWAFTPASFQKEWTVLIARGYLKPGDTVCVAQAGWVVNLDEGLREKFPGLAGLKTQMFGNNIRFFRLQVGDHSASAKPSDLVIPQLP